VKEQQRRLEFGLNMSAFTLYISPFIQYYPNPCKTDRLPIF